MTQTEFNAFISTMDGHQLEALRRKIERQEQIVYDRKENFHLHDRTDNYIYIVNYQDGSFIYDYLGSRAYERYIDDPTAVSIDRKTKDLFPVYEHLLSKEKES